MPVPVGGGFATGPSCFDRMKMGFTIGFCVGLASGALFGGFTALRYAYFIIPTTLRAQNFSIL